MANITLDIKKPGTWPGLTCITRWGGKDTWISWGKLPRTEFSLSQPQTLLYQNLLQLVGKTSPAADRAGQQQPCRRPTTNDQHHAICMHAHTHQSRWFTHPTPAYPALLHWDNRLACCMAKTQKNSPKRESFCTIFSNKNIRDK